MHYSNAFAAKGAASVHVLFTQCIYTQRVSGRRADYDVKRGACSPCAEQYSLARANRPLICTLFREKMTIFRGKLAKNKFFCQVPTIKGLADAMCSKFGWVAPSQCRCSGIGTMHRCATGSRASCHTHPQHTLRG